MPTASIPAAISAIGGAIGIGSAGTGIAGAATLADASAATIAGISTASVPTVGASLGAIAAGPIGTIAGGALASAAASKLLAGGSPKPPKPAAQSDPGNPLLLQSQKQAATLAQKQSGRASTILSQPALTDYSSPTLGAGG